MRRRCFGCGKFASGKGPCNTCGRIVHTVHCHNRDHCGHHWRADGGPRAFGYESEDLGPCTDFHLHPYDGWAHWDAPAHKVVDNSLSSGVESSQ